MRNISTIYKISVLVFVFFINVSGSRCPVMECWFVHEKPGRGGGLGAPLTQEKSLMYIRTDSDDEMHESRRHPPSDIDPSRIYFVTDPAATFCTSTLHSPEGSVNKIQCEINPFNPQASVVQWTATLTDSGQSPIYLQADWFSVAAQGLDGQLTLSNVMRAPTASKEPNVVLSVSSRTASVSSRLGKRVILDCGFWVDPSSPLRGEGFSVEWRYQFRGEGRLVLAYDGKKDRFAESAETGAELDVAALHETGNASLILVEAQVRHSGTYICTVYLPHLLAQVTVALDIVEPPSISIFPSTLPLFVPGQVVMVQCEASGFAPLSLDLSWEFVEPDGKVRPLGPSSITGHRQAWDGTFSQSSRLELDAARQGLGRGGEVRCVAQHAGGTRRSAVTLNVIAISAPSIEDSMAMVAVALVLYGMIKLLHWTFSSPDCSATDSKVKKEQ